MSVSTVERNDVDISRLFDWSKETFIEGKDGKKIKVYLRLLGDADVSRARVMSLRESAELRKRLRDPESDERIAYIPYKEELDKYNLVESIIMFTMRDTTQKAMKEVVLPRPKDPGSEASTEKLEKFQKEVDEYPKKREEAIRDIMGKLVDARRKELSELDEDTLYKQYENALINELCEQRLMDRFKEYCIFLGSYSDKKFTTKFFDSFETLKNLPTSQIDKLIEEYSILEVHPEELKK